MHQQWSDEIRNNDTAVIQSHDIRSANSDSKCTIIAVKWLLLACVFADCT